MFLSSDYYMVEHVGCVLSREIPFLGADVVEVCGRQHKTDRKGEIRLDLARSKTTSMHVSIMCGNREIASLIDIPY
jgi:hypothetical protein